jgi:hypothetical protein
MIICVHTHTHTHTHIYTYFARTENIGDESNIMKAGTCFFKPYAASMGAR